MNKSEFGPRDIAVTAAVDYVRACALFCQVEMGVIYWLSQNCCNQNKLWTVGWLLYTSVCVDLEQKYFASFGWLLLFVKGYYGPQHEDFILPHAIWCVSTMNSIPSIIFHTKYWAVFIQLTHLSDDDCENTCTLSYFTIKSEVWTNSHCLGLGHETIAYVVCLPISLGSTKTLPLATNLAVCFIFTRIGQLCDKYALWRLCLFLISYLFLELSFPIYFEHHK